MNVIIIAAVVVKPQPSSVDEITSRVLNLSVEGINFLMHTLGKWREDQRLLMCTPNNVAKLIRYANEKGFNFNINVEINQTWNYYLFGQAVTDEFGHTCYEITGITHEMYEFVKQFETLAEEIANDEGMQVVLDYAERYNK